MDAITTSERDGPRGPTPGAASTASPTPTMRWIVPGYVGEGLTILAGREKVGKTWLALDFALAVASGGLAMGSVACDKGCAAYIDYENGERRLRARFERLRPGGRYDKPGHRPDVPRLLWFHGVLPEENLTEWFDQLRTSAGDLRLIVFDAGRRLARAAGRGSWTDRGSRGAVMRELEELQRWSVEHGVAVLYLARALKGGGDAASNRLFGAADATLLLELRDDRPTLRLRSRDIAERTTALAFDAGRWSVVGDAGEIHRSLRRLLILEVLETSRWPIAAGEVAGALGLPVANVRKMMFRMARAGELERRGRGLYVLAGAECERTMLLSQTSHVDGNAIKTMS
jgi:hypothetical protein